MRTPRSRDGHVARYLLNLSGELQSGGARRRAAFVTGLALRFWGNSENVVLAHAINLDSLGRIDESIETLHSALPKFPDSIELRVGLAELLLRSPDGRTEAEELILQALSKDPGSENGHIVAAMLAVDREDWDDARLHIDNVRGNASSASLARAEYVALGVPGGIMTAERLLEKALVTSAGVEPRLLLAALVEPRDPERAERLLAEARHFWFGSTEDFEAAVDEMRETAKAAQRDEE